MITTTTAAHIIGENESEAVGNWEDEVVKEEERKQRATTALPLQGAWAKSRPAAVHEPPPVVSKREDPWGTRSSKPAEPPVASKREDPWGTRSSKPVEEPKPAEPPRTNVTSYAAVSKGVSPTESPVPPVTQPSPAKGAWDGKNTRIAPKKMAYAQVASSRVSSAPTAQPEAQAATKTGNTAGMVTLSIKPRSRNV